jgi:ribonuclease-3
VRAALVGEPALATAARDLDLGERLWFGRGEERSGGREKPSILAGGLEALVGAVFLDGGWRSAYRLCCAIFRGPAGRGLAAGQAGDAKDTAPGALPGAPARDPGLCAGRAERSCAPAALVAEARLGERVLGRGEGWSRKSAEAAGGSGPRGRR